MAADGDVVTVVRACRWAGNSRRSYYYRPTQAKPRINEHLAARVKRVISDLPYAGYRTVAWLLGENKNTIQQGLAGAQALQWSPPPGAGITFGGLAPARWATDIARVWCGSVHRWCALTIVMDCHTREALGWRLSPSGNAKAAEAALEEALITRYGTLGRAQDPITLRSDNGLVFTSRHYTRTVYQYGLKQEFIRPHTPQQNGMVERLIRTVKEQCLWLHNFQSLDEARQTLRAWFKYYNEQRPHQALGIKTPSTVYQQLAA